MARSDKRPYVTVAIDWFENPKFALLSEILGGKMPLLREARDLYLGSIVYCARNLTDGIFSVAMAQREALSVSRKCVQALYEAGLWIDRGKGMAEVHDYGKHQATRAEREKLSAAGRKARQSHNESSTNRSEIVNESCNQVEVEVNTNTSNEVFVDSVPAEAQPKPAPQTAKPKSKPKPARPLPDDWEPNPHHAQLAAEHGKDLALEAAKFRDWAANQKPRRDWDASFNNWLRNHAYDDQRIVSGREPPSRLAEWAQAAAMVEAQQASGQALIGEGEPTW